MREDRAESVAEEGRTSLTWLARNERFSRRKLFALGGVLGVGLIAAAFVGCSDDDDDDDTTVLPTAAGTSTATAEPTATEEPSATAEPTATDEPTATPTETSGGAGIAQSSRIAPGRIARSQSSAAPLSILSG